MADSLATPAQGLPRAPSPYLTTGTATYAADPKRNSVLTDGNGTRTMSTSSVTKVDPAVAAPSRGNTILKKSASVNRRSSLKRSSSRKSLRAGSMKYMGDGGDEEDFTNVFNTPVPTSGSPTDILANRFQAWRKLIKDLITYFREIQSSYENRSKTLIKVSNVLNNLKAPEHLISSGGLEDAQHVLTTYHKSAITEATKARDIETDVITQLSGLRNDLNTKIKEINSLKSDFKNTVDKEKDQTKRMVASLQDALRTSEKDPGAATGKGDPYIVRLGVERQIERQMEEENYLHRAYLNLENSGRELETIVVGELQKAYNALAGILKREADNAQETVEELRAGPISMPKDHEWQSFVHTDPHFINPSIPLRRVEDVTYPGKYDPGALEIRAGMLERKSKYLKSYTAGWYVLSPTHLHEFKSADHIKSQTPVMSLALVDQRLGSHSQTGGNSNKFSLKGRQTGAMHRGHSWVFRAESYDTMMAWYEDIKALTEKTGAEKSAFVRQHARSFSGGSHRAPSVSSDGMGEDEADAIPYSAQHSLQQEVEEPAVKRPEPGGRFPSQLEINRIRSSAPLSSSGSSELHRDVASGPPEVVGAAAVAAYSPDDRLAPSSQDQQQQHQRSVSEATVIGPNADPQPAQVPSQVAEESHELAAAPSPTVGAAPPVILAAAAAAPAVHTENTPKKEQIPQETQPEQQQPESEADSVPTPTQETPTPAAGSAAEGTIGGLVGAGILTHDPSTAGPSTATTAKSSNGAHEYFDPTDPADRAKERHGGTEHVHVPGEYPPTPSPYVE